MFLPAGSRDEMGVSINNRLDVMEVFRRLVTQRGYQQISTPVVEYANTFTNEYIEMKLQDMMKWFNPEGEIEVLRPDWTTAIARALSSHEHVPQKWAYQGSVFQRTAPGVEIRQIGVELLHLPELMGEAESLLLAQDFLKELGVGGSLIELGHTEIYESLASELDLSKADQERLRIAMHDKKKDEVYQIAKSSGNQKNAEELAALVDAFGNLDILTEYEERWKDRNDLLKILDHIRQLARIIQDSGNSDILVDLGRVKNLPYYSGMMFRGFLQKTGAECFSGGRYDRLYEQFGESISAVGIALDVETLAVELPEQEKTKTICLLANSDSLAYTETLRKTTFKDSIVHVQTEPTSKIGYDAVYEVKKLNGTYEVIKR